MRWRGGLVRWVVNIERISAVTLKVARMRNAVRFYRDVLGMEIIYGGEDDCFSSLRTKQGKGPILNLEQGPPAVSWADCLLRYGRGCDLGHTCRKKVFIRRVRRTLHGANDISICPIRMGMSCRLRVRYDTRHECREAPGSRDGPGKEVPMAYYKIRFEVWCDWSPEESDLEEIAQNISAGEAICTKRV